MPSATVPNAPVHIPAWKRLGLKLKSAQETSEPAGEPVKEPDSTKRKGLETSADSTPAKKAKKTSKHLEKVDSNVKVSSHDKVGSHVPVTPQFARKKSVTFTPDTKAEDGDSIKQLFTTWVAEKKSIDPSFQFNSNPVFNTPEPPRLDPRIEDEASKTERRLKRIKEAKRAPPRIEAHIERGANFVETERGVKRAKKPTPEKSEKSKAPKKPAKVTKPPARPLRPFLEYLKDYCESRSTWKFNKNLQNHLLRNAFDVEVVPSDHTYYLFAYVRGLQGGVRARLRDTALWIKVKDQEDGAVGFPTTMADSEKRQREYDAAMKDYVATMTAVNAPEEMGYEEGVLLGLGDRLMAGRVAKRMRAERILTELGSSPEDAEAVDKEGVNGNSDGQKRLRMNDGTPQKVARKRKQRTVYDDNNSSSSEDSSDSDDHSSDDSGEQDDNLDEDETSSSSSSSSEESDSEEEDSDDESEEDSEESDSE